MMEKLQTFIIRTRKIKIIVKFNSLGDGVNSNNRYYYFETGILGLYELQAISL